MLVVVMEVKVVKVVMRVIVVVMVVGLGVLSCSLSL